MNTFRVSNNLDPDEAKYFAGPDLGLNYLQKLSPDGTIKYANSFNLFDPFSSVSGFVINCPPDVKMIFLHYDKICKPNRYYTIWLVFLQSHFFKVTSKPRCKEK